MRIFLLHNKEKGLNILRSVFHEGGEQLGSKTRGFQFLLDVLSFNRDTHCTLRHVISRYVCRLHRETRCVLFYQFEH